MKNFKKLLAVLCVMSLVLGTFTIPVNADAAEEGKTIFSLDYEGPEILLEENFEDTVPVMAQYSTYPLPYNTIKDGDEDHNSKYLSVDATKNVDGVVQNSGNRFGLYKFKDDMLTKSEGGAKYKVSFDFRFNGATNYETTSTGESVSSVVLMDEGGKGYVADNFKLLSIKSDGVFQVNHDPATMSWSGDLTLEKGKWYHYEISFDMEGTSTAGKVVVTDSSGKKATVTRYMDVDRPYDSIMWTTGVNVDMDNILVERLSGGYAPPQVSFEGKSAARNITSLKTEENGNHYGDVNAVYNANNTDWVFDGYTFSEPITSGKWDISFKFNMQYEYSYALMALAPSNVTGKETSQFGLLTCDTTNHKVTVDKTALTGSLEPELDKWYTYNMVVNKDKNTYSVEITDGEKIAKGKGSIAQTGNFDGIMFGAKMHVLIDDILVKQHIDVFSKSRCNSRRTRWCRYYYNVFNASHTGYNAQC